MGIGKPQRLRTRPRDFPGPWFSISVLECDLANQPCRDGFREGKTRWNWGFEPSSLGFSPLRSEAHMAIEPERVKALFLAAIERGDTADRRAFLDAEVGDDAELRDRLAALLAAYDQPPSALDRPLAVSSPPAGGTGGDGTTVD